MHELLKKASPILKECKDYILDDLAQRLQCKILRKNTVLKDFGVESNCLYIICSGSIGVYDRKMHKTEKGNVYDADENDA